MAFVDIPGKGLSVAPGGRLVLKPPGAWADAVQHPVPIIAMRTKADVNFIVVFIPQDQPVRPRRNQS